jgi:hypothetical protein
MTKILMDGKKGEKSGLTGYWFNSIFRKLFSGTSQKLVTKFF